MVINVKLLVLSLVPLPYGLDAVVFGLLMGLTVGPGAILVWRNTVRRSLREQLIEKGIPICLKCGYDLRGQAVPRCPECGAPFAAIPRSDDVRPVSDEAATRAEDVESAGPAAHDESLT